MPHPSPPTLGALLRAARDGMGMSRAALSRETGLDLAYLERIEADVVQAPSWFTVVLIADALGAELEEFRPGVKPPPKKGKATA